MFLRNCWYVAAWSKDVGRKPFGRVILNEYVVLYRKENGEPVALENRCAHRNLPLSEGRLIGDQIQCGYHGIVYDQSGRCTRVPGTTAVPSWARVKAFPVAEKHGWVFIFMGAPSLADRRLIPVFHARLNDPDWIAITGQTHAKCGYRLILDNLLDLSHVAYVHGSSTGNPEIAEHARVETEVVGNSVRVTRSMKGIPAAAVYSEYGNYNGSIDRWQVTIFYPPSYIFINNGSYPAGQTPANNDVNLNAGTWGYHVYHAATPETEATTHQFWGVTHSRQAVAPEKMAKWKEQNRTVVEEDLAVYEAQQRCIDLDPNAVARDANPRGVLHADQGLMKARAILERLYADEQRQGAKATVL